MARAARVGNAVSGSTSTVTSSFSSGSAPDSTHGLICWAWKDSATPVSAVAGFTQVGSSIVVGARSLTLWKARGNGSLNSAIVTTGGATTVALIEDYAGVYDDDFVSWFGAGNNSNGTSQASGAGSATEDGMIASAFIKLSSTGSAFAFSNSYDGTTIANGTSFAAGEKDLPTSGTDASTTASWTTTRANILGVALLRVTEPPPPPPTGPRFSLWTGDGTLDHEMHIVGVKTA